MNSKIRNMDKENQMTKDEIDRLKEEAEAANKKVSIVCSGEDMGRLG